MVVAAGSGSVASGPQPLELLQRSRPGMKRSMPQSTLLFGNGKRSVELVMMASWERRKE